MLKETIAKIVREFYFKTPLKKYFFHRFPYMFNPAQLMFLCQCLDSTKNLNGAILEVGCAYGHTTVFLNKYLESQRTVKPYFCVDTFGGFVVKDMDYEKLNRGKNPNDFKEKFVINKKKWVDFTIKSNGIKNVTTFQDDISNFDFQKNNINKLSFCLLDVDLYLPMKSALNKIWEILEPGGIIIVDDCMSHEFFDGALQAYCEFVANKGLPFQCIHERLGIIEKKL